MDPLAGRWDSVRDRSHSGRCGEMQDFGQLESRQSSIKLQDRVGLQFPERLMWSA